MSLETNIAEALSVTVEEAQDLITYVRTNHPNAEMDILGFDGAYEIDLLPVMLAYKDEWEATISG
jgi:hypothetical protein